MSGDSPTGAAATNPFLAAYRRITGADSPTLPSPAPGPVEAGARAGTGPAGWRRRHSSELDEILRTFGVVPAEDFTAVEALVALCLAGKDIRAEVVSVRWGRLVLATDPVGARLVEFERSNLLDAVAAYGITDLVVRVARRR